MAATNVPADRMPEFYSCCITRAQELVPLCSLQQLADLSWAFFRAQASPTSTFHLQVRESALSWVTAQLGTLDMLPLISREDAHEAANFLSRLFKAQLLHTDDPLSRQMLFIVAAGINQACPIRSADT